MQLLTYCTQWYYGVLITWFIGQNQWPDLVSPYLGTPAALQFVITRTFYFTCIGLGRYCGCKNYIDCIIIGWIPPIGETESSIFPNWDACRFWLFITNFAIPLNYTKYDDYKNYILNYSSRSPNCVAVEASITSLSFVKWWPLQLDYEGMFSCNVMGLYWFYSPIFTLSKGVWSHSDAMKSRPFDNHMYMCFYINKDYRCSPDSRVELDLNDLPKGL